MTHRLGLFLFAAFMLAALLCVVAGALMLVNHVPDAIGGTMVLWIAAGCLAGMGAGLRYVLGWRRR